MMTDNEPEQHKYKELRETHRQYLMIVNEMGQSLVVRDPKIWGRLHFLGSLLSESRKEPRLKNGPQPRRLEIFYPLIEEQPYILRTGFLQSMQQEVPLHDDWLKGGR
jgi:hypothetical protein